jgi:hypothetical protein
MSTPPNFEIWPDELAPSRLPEIAALVENLLVNEPRWVHRRVEAITLLDEGLVRRNTSIDFTLPRLLKDEPKSGVHFVPVTLVMKDVLRKLDVRDEAGAALSILTKRENGPIAGEVLVGHANTILARSAELPLLEATANQLRFVADRETRHPFAVADSDRALAQHQSERLEADRSFVALLRELSRQFIVIVPLAIRQDQRKIVKFGYEVRLSRELRRGTAEGWFAFTRRRLVRRLENVLDVFGLSDFNVELETPALFDTESYHVEVVGSDELAISSARLYRALGEDEAGMGAPGANAPSDQRWTLLAEDNNTQRAHLYTSDVQPKDLEAAKVVADFRLRPELVWPAVLFLGVVSGTFAVALALHFMWDVQRSRDAPAALLIALPALLAPLATPGSHPLTRRMFKGLRGLVIVSALVLFGASGSLVVGLSTSALEVIWGVCAAATLVFTSVALVAWLRSKRKTRALPLEAEYGED